MSDGGSSGSDEPINVNFENTPAMNLCGLRLEFSLKLMSDGKRRRSVSSAPLTEVRGDPLKAGHRSAWLQIQI